MSHKRVVRIDSQHFSNKEFLMPHDRNNVELKNGDKVLIEATVTNLQPNDQFCNCTFEIVKPAETGMPGKEYLTTNTRICEKAIVTTAAPAFPKTTPEHLFRRYGNVLKHNDSLPSPEDVGTIRKAIMDAACVILEKTPMRPEQTRAFNALDEALFLALAAIDRA
jgi:hypothetical protein